jgi:hypothetical protein
MRQASLCVVIRVCVRKRVASAHLRGLVLGHCSCCVVLCCVVLLAHLLVHFGALRPPFPWQNAPDYGQATYSDFNTAYFGAARYYSYSTPTPVMQQLSKNLAPTV